MIKKFLSTDQQSYALLAVRVALGVVLLPHGMQKALGMFGCYGFSGTVGFFGQMGIPAIVATLVIMAEFLGSAALILGFGTRFMAASIFVTMLGAMVMGGHLQNGFFMNWFGNQAGEGVEFFILVFGLAIASLVGGSGRFSIDNLISKRLK
ncbi:DoxX family protein [Alistipes sp. ZOR0009]|uniref:DoxX family protein n=1 Tax=Alistipes sp. ZOR0009 TaxID=1339253 RepID=UPI0006472490|nr:DoxX family protein [Alistipes sp. ZOR0009]